MEEKVKEVKEEKEDSNKSKYVFGYYYDFDDPYKVLAADLAGSYSPGAVKEMIENEAVLLSEARENIIEGIDIATNYGDWAMDLMLRHNKRKLRELSEDFVDGILECVDIKRLQKELKMAFYMLPS